MATVAVLIRRSLQILGVVAEGESATAQQESDAFAALNDMLDAWAAEGLDVSTFTATTSEVDLAPGYARAIRYNLAAEIADEFGEAMPPLAASIAVESKATLKRNNHTQDFLECDPAVLRPGPFDPVSGD